MTQALQNMQILIISNNESECNTIQTALNQEGITKVDTCNNTSDAIQLLSSLNYDLVFTEAYLPILSGFDLKQLMDSFNISIPLVFFSEQFSENAIKEAAYAGVKKCITTETLSQEVPALMDELFVLR